MRLSTTLNIFSFRKDGNTSSRMLEGIWACKEAGFDAIDLHLNDIDRLLSYDEQERFVEKVKETAKAAQLHISQAHARFGYVENYSDPMQLEEYYQHVIHTIGLAERIGAPWVVIHPLDFMMLLRVKHDEMIRMNVEFFERAIAAVPRIGLAFENLGQSYFCNAERLIELRKAAGDHERFGFCWDTGHANLIEGLDQTENIMQLGNKLKCTHVHDNRGERDDHVMPYMGSIDWPKVVHALKNSGYQGDFVYESAQPLKYLPDDNVLRLEFMKYTVKLGRYLLQMP